MGRDQQAWYSSFDATEGILAAIVVSRFTKRAKRPVEAKAMVVFSYGIPRSGSTLAFRIATCVAALGGHRQSLQHWDLRLAEQRLRVNGAWELDPDVLTRLAEKFRDGILVVKTHSLPSPLWIATYSALASSNLVSAHVNHRDPRDICLALLDAGAMARARHDSTFSEFVSLDVAVDAVARCLNAIAVWDHLPNVVTLRYEINAFRTDEAIDTIKAHFGVRCSNALVRFYLRWIAFTQRNKAIPERHRGELNPAMAAQLSERFGDYLQRMGYEP